MITFTFIALAALITVIFELYVFTGTWYILLSLIIGILGSFIFLVLLTLLLLWIFTKTSPESKFKQFYIRSFCKFALILMRIKVKVEGFENISDNVTVFFPNHKSYMDVLIMYVAVKRPVSFVSKKDNYKVPLLSLALRSLNCISLDRDNDREGAKDLINAIRLVKKGHSMIIFPEGGIRDRGRNEMVDVRPGAYKLATKAEADIVPVSIKNNHLIQYNCFKRRTNVTVKFYKAIKKDEYRDIHTIDIGEKVMEIVNKDLK